MSTDYGCIKVTMQFLLYTNTQLPRTGKLMQDDLLTYEDIEREFGFKKSTIIQFKKPSVNKWPPISYRGNKQGFIRTEVENAIEKINDARRKHAQIKSQNGLHAVRVAHERRRARLNMRRDAS